MRVNEFIRMTSLGKANWCCRWEKIVSSFTEGQNDWMLKIGGDGRGNAYTVVMFKNCTFTYNKDIYLIKICPKREKGITVCLLNYIY